ncbi:MAG TPA: N,N-dimethylformamidase beta subunit family domain-containing protein, partial [Nitrososphaeraceae archaeon]
GNAASNSVSNGKKATETISNATSNTGTGTGAGASTIVTEGDIKSPPPPKTQLHPQVIKIKHKAPVSLSSLGLRHNFSMSKPSIAIVVPVFTAAAYNDAFYTFYKHFQFAKVGQNITKNLYLLSTKITSPKFRVISALDASSSSLPYLVKHLELAAPRVNLSVITDVDVDSGSIFTNNLNTTNRYNILILGHQEYVTQQEYNNFRTFVANGGTLLLLDGNVFYAQVGYDRPTHTITLIKGHGWAYNGKSAWKSVGERWFNETSQWVGSNYLCSSCVIKFANNPFEYMHREEQYLTNNNDTLLLNYNESYSTLNPNAPKDLATAHSYTVGAYELQYKKGLVIGTGLYADQIITNRSFLVFLDHLLFG